MKTFLLASLALATSAIPATAFAQDAVPHISPQGTLLTVSADGSVSRRPDVAIFTAGVTSTGATASAALTANSADMAKVIAALRRAGIAERDIQTSNLSLNPVYADNSRQPGSPLQQQLPTIIGYQASNMVTVKQRKLSEFGKVIDTLVSAGANQVNGPSFQVDQPDSALDEARLAAVKKARERANLYAGATGLKVGRILSINESGSYSPRPMMMARMAASDSAGAPPVAEGEVALTANITVSFELTP
jgi:uncharacterized protein YggE